jgi:hypothetical protein
MAAGDRLAHTSFHGLVIAGISQCHGMCCSDGYLRIT